MLDRTAIDALATDTVSPDQVPFTLDTLGMCDDHCKELTATDP